MLEQKLANDIVSRTVRGVINVVVDKVYASDSPEERAAAKLRYAKEFAEPTSKGIHALLEAVSYLSEARTQLYAGGVRLPPEEKEEQQKLEDERVGRFAAIRDGFIRRYGSSVLGTDSEFLSLTGKDIAERINPISQVANIISPSLNLAENLHHDHARHALASYGNGVALTDAQLEAVTYSSPGMATLVNLSDIGVTATKTALSAGAIKWLKGEAAVALSMFLSSLIGGLRATGHELNHSGETGEDISISRIVHNTGVGASHSLFYSALLGTLHKVLSKLGPAAKALELTRLADRIGAAGGLADSANIFAATHNRKMAIGAFLVGLASLIDAKDAGFVFGGSSAKAPDPQPRKASAADAAAMALAADVLLPKQPIGDEPPTSPVQPLAPEPRLIASIPPVLHAASKPLPPSQPPSGQLELTHNIIPPDKDRPLLNEGMQAASGGGRYRPVPHRQQGRNADIDRKLTEFEREPDAGKRFARVVSYWWSAQSSVSPAQIAKILRLLAEGGVPATADPRQVAAVTNSIRSRLGSFGHDSTLTPYLEFLERFAPGDSGGGMPPPGDLVQALRAGSAAVITPRALELNSQLSTIGSDRTLSFESRVRNLQKLWQDLRGEMTGLHAATLISALAHISEAARRQNVTLPSAIVKGLIKDAVPLLRDDLPNRDNKKLSAIALAVATLPIEDRSVVEHLAEVGKQRLVSGFRDNQALKAFAWLSGAKEIPHLLDCVDEIALKVDLNASTISSIAYSHARLRRPNDQLLIELADRLAPLAGQVSTEILSLRDFAARCFELGMPHREQFDRLFDAVAKRKDLTVKDLIFFARIAVVLSPANAEKFFSHLADRQITMDELPENQVSQLLLAITAGQYKNEHWEGALRSRISAMAPLIPHVSAFEQRVFDALSKMGYHPRANVSVHGIMPDALIEIDGNLIAVEADGFDSHYVRLPDGSRRLQGGDQLRDLAASNAGMKTVRVVAEDAAHLSDGELFRYLRQKITAVSREP